MMRVTRLAAALIGGFAVASAPSVSSAQQAGSRETREFVQAAGESDTFEIMEAYSALAQSTDPQVLAFARAMIRDHDQTSRTLADATARAKLDPPKMAVGASRSPLLAALQSARGHDFDTLYWKHQALSHRSALVVEQRYATSGDSPDVRAAAAAAVPLIQAHLAMAESQQAKSSGS